MKTCFGIQLAGLLMVLLIIPFIPNTVKAHNHYDPCPCCVLVTFTPNLNENVDVECANDITIQANADILEARTRCFVNGLALYDQWSTDYALCRDRFENISQEKWDQCKHEADLAVWELLTLVQNTYLNRVYDITLQAQWDIDYTCY